MPSWLALVLADLPKEGEAAALKRSLDVLTRASQAPQSLPREAKSATHPQVGKGSQLGWGCRPGT